MQIQLVTLMSARLKLSGASIVLAATLLSATAFAQQKPVLQAAPVPAAATSAPALPTASGEVSATAYKISAGDMLQLTVWKEPNMSNPGVPVRPDGKISLALLGDISAAGFSPMELGDDIANRLKKYVNDPLVTVTVLAVQPKQIYLMGEIAHVGPVPLTEGLSPLQAIATAGGLSPYAKASKIYILRKASDKEQKIPFDYKKAIKNGDLQGVSLMSGDTIVVP
jgi:polysaccharide export outer membrane protein